MDKKNNNKIPAFILKLKNIVNTFTKSEQSVVNYIIDHPDEVIYLSVSALAERSGVSDATVIRTCYKCGMSGYQELKLTLAQDIITPLQNIHEEITENDSTSVVVNKVFQSVIHTVSFTNEVIKPEEIEAAANAIRNAKTVSIFGLGNSHAIALDMQHKMMRLGIRATAYTDSHLQTIIASHLEENDVLFAISHSGSSKDVVEAVRIAKANKAKVISLTNIGRSPLYDIADIRLCTASNETRYRIIALSSRVAQITIIDAIYTLISLQMKDKALAGFHRLEKALKSKKY